MKAQRILCPIDFSVPGTAALDVASKLARQTQAKLYLVHVEENPAVVNPGLFGGLPPSSWRDSHELALTLPTATEVRFEHDLLLGDPATEIVRFAEEHDVDLIVMGTHGHSGVLRALLGSVAEHVVRHATVPVLTLKPSATQLADAAA